MLSSLRVEATNKSNSFREWIPSFSIFSAFFGNSALVVVGSGLPMAEVKDNARTKSLFSDSQEGTVERTGAGNKLYL